MRAESVTPRFDMLDVERMESMVDEGGSTAAAVEDLKPPELLLGRPVLAQAPFDRGLVAEQTGG